MEKSQSKKPNVFKTPPVPWINFVGSFIDRLRLAKVNFATATNRGLSAKGRARNLYYYHAGLGQRHFRPNQRKEQALSMRRKTKPSARN